MMFRSLAVLPWTARLLLAAALVLGLSNVSAQDLDFVDSGQFLGNDQGKAVALDDLDGDGDLDALIANGNNFTSSPNKIYINQGGAQGGMAGQFQASGQLLGGTSNSQSVALGDLDGDGDLDAFVANGFNIAGSADVIYWNDGNGTFQAAVQDLGDQSSSDVALADIDGDGDLDAIVTDPSNGFPFPNRIWINQGGTQGGVEGTFVDGGTLGTSSGRTVALDDLDGDGDVDAMIGGALTGLEIWINQGGAQAGTPGAFVDSGQRLVLGNGFAEAVYLVDFDGDGDLDAYAANAGFNPEDATWINPGPDTDGNPGQFQVGWTGPARLSLGTAIADFDGDGDPDVFVAHADSTGGRANAVWLNDGSGILSDTGLALGDSQSSAAAAGDVDGDGDIDVMVANRGPAPDRLWLAESTGGGPAVADLVMNAEPQGLSRFFLPSSSTGGTVIGMDVDITNLGPDPATGVVLRVFGAQVIGADEFSCEIFGSDTICTIDQLEVDEAVDLFASKTVLVSITSGNIFRGGGGFTVQLRSNEPDPTPLGRSADRSVELYDCDSGCPIESLFCLISGTSAASDDRSKDNRDDLAAIGTQVRAMAGQFMVDLPVYYLLRQTMNHGDEGQRLVQRYAAHQAEIWGLMEQDPELMDDALAVLESWQPLFVALVTGDSESEFVTQARSICSMFSRSTRNAGQPCTGPGHRRRTCLDRPVR